MNRRGFLSAMLAAGAAPAIVRADSLMRIVPRETLVDMSALAAGDYWGRRLDQLAFQVLTTDMKQVWSRALMAEVNRPPSNFSRFFVGPA